MKATIKRVFMGEQYDFSPQRTQRSTEEQEKENEEILNHRFQ